MTNVRNATLLAAALGLAAAGCKASFKAGDAPEKKPKPEAKAEPPKVAAPKKPKRQRRARMNAEVKRVEIDDKVMFASGKAELLPESNALLDDVAEVLQENPEATVEVAGHTDATGSADLNRRLSNDRAEAVKRYLMTKGVAEGRLTSKGYGPDEPLDSNDTDQGKEKNRSVEFRVVAPGKGDVGAHTTGAAPLQKKP